MFVRVAAPLGAVLALSACVVAPAPVVTVPGYNKTEAAYEADEASCRQEGSQAAYSGTAQAPAPGGPPAIGTRSGNEAAWDRYDQQFASCMAAHGNSVAAAPYAGYAYPNGYPYAGYAYPYAGYAYPYAFYGYPYGFGYPFGFYDGIGFGFGYGRFGYGRFGYGRSGYGGFGHVGFAGHFGGGRR